MGHALRKQGKGKGVQGIKESVGVDVSDGSGNTVREKEGIDGSVSVDVSDGSGNTVREKEGIDGSVSVDVSDISGSMIKEKELKGSKRVSVLMSVTSLETW